MNLRFGLPIGFEASGLIVRVRTGAAFWMWLASGMAAPEYDAGMSLLEQAIESIERPCSAGGARFARSVNSTCSSYQTAPYGLGSPIGVAGTVAVSVSALSHEEAKAVLERLIWFMRGGKDVDARQARERNAAQPEDGNGRERMLDYEKDLDAIYAAFLQAYGLDLYAEHGGALLIETLHWWRFLALVENLPPGSMLVDYYMHYRGLDARKLPRKTGPEREHLRRVIDIKRRVALDAGPRRKKAEPAYARRARELMERRTEG